MKQADDPKAPTPPSRTRRKKEDQARKALGHALVALGAEQRAAVDMPSELREAVQLACQTRRHGARRRQMQYIGTLMRHVEVTSIHQALLEIEQGTYRRAREFHRIEAWRDQLVAGDDTVFENILSLFPDADRQRLGQLVRSARKEKLKNAKPKSARNLFRYLKQLTGDS